MLIVSEHQRDHFFIMCTVTFPISKWLENWTFLSCFFFFFLPVSSQLPKSLPSSSNISTARCTSQDESNNAVATSSSEGNDINIYGDSVVGSAGSVTSKKVVVLGGA